MDTSVSVIPVALTASEILTRLKTVDGSGSGLDADETVGGVASHIAASDAHHTPSGAIEGTVALFQANAATGTFNGNPERINDNAPDVWGNATAIDQYAEVDFGIVVSLNQFRHYGESTQNGDGAWKIEYYNLVTHAWADWVTGIATRTAESWTSMDSSGGEIITDKIRITCTTVDSGGQSKIGELEVVYG
jgi:hypothetical protein